MTLRQTLTGIGPAMIFLAIGLLGFAQAFAQATDDQAQPNDHFSLLRDAVKKSEAEQKPDDATAPPKEAAPRPAAPAEVTPPPAPVAETAPAAPPPAAAPEVAVETPAQKARREMAEMEAREARKTEALNRAALAKAKADAKKPLAPPKKPAASTVSSSPRSAG